MACLVGIPSAVPKSCSSKAYTGKDDQGKMTHAVDHTRDSTLRNSLVSK